MYASCSPQRKKYFYSPGPRSGAARFRSDPFGEKIEARSKPLRRTGPTGQQQKAGIFRAFGK
jgi:hypothetical protein